MQITDHEVGLPENPKQILTNTVLSNSSVRKHSSSVRKHSSSEDSEATDSRQSENSGVVVGVHPMKV